jgi:signal peptidase
MAHETQSSMAADPSRRRAGVAQAVRDVVFAVVAVGVVIGSVFAYSGVWPPMVVVESGSMMHDDSDSAIGVIDTGDLTLTKKLSSERDLITYQQGVRLNYKTYGSYGDVIIYAKNGHFEQTPIIHRAITRLVLNGSNQFDLPEAFPPLYGLSASDQSVAIGPVWTWDSQHPGGREVNLTLNMQRIVSAMNGYLHGGFITKGDHNGQIDQGQLPSLPPEGHPGSGFVEPVMFDWAVGKAEGELPWFGLIKLWAGGARGPLPPNSQVNLVIAIAVILLGPYAVERAWERHGHSVKDKVPTAWKERFHRARAKLPGAAGRERRRLVRQEVEEAHRRELKRRGRSRGR